MEVAVVMTGEMSSVVKQQSRFTSLLYLSRFFGIILFTK